MRPAEAPLEEHRSIKLSTYGIMFMGTPRQGGSGVALSRLMVNVASMFVAADDRLLRHLERDSEALQQLLREGAVWAIRRSSSCEDLSYGRSRWLVNRVLNAASHSRTIITLTSTFNYNSSGLGNTGRSAGTL
jgi:hypothetical protein